MALAAVGDSRATVAQPEPQTAAAGPAVQVPKRRGRRGPPAGDPIPPSQLASEVRERDSVTVTRTVRTPGPMQFETKKRRY